MHENPGLIAGVASSVLLPRVRYADPDVLRNSETKAVRGGVQTMPAGRTCRCSSIPFSVYCGRLPSVRRTAPVSPLRGCPGNASSFGGEAGTGGAKLSWPLPR
jgi:hypothetical protein